MRCIVGHSKNRCSIVSIWRNYTKIT